MKKISLGFIATLMAWTLWLSPAQAQLAVDVTRGTVKAMPIALPKFQVGTAADQSLADSMVKVIENNLASTGLFKPLDPKSFLTASPTVDTTPRFQDWRLAKAQTLLVAKMTREGQTLTVDFRLWDVLAENQMAGRRLSTPAANWRQLAHIIADAIYTRVTGEAGYFNTRVVYIAESGALNRRVKRLAIMDQDGANHQYLTDGRGLALTPRFSPTEQLITYMAYERSGPTVYLYELTSGRRRVLGNFPGMSFAPRFSPDGQKVVMSIAKGGNTDIFVMPIHGGSLQKLTNTPSIETAPSFSPDGKFIAFESDRSGTQQLYVMRADGSDQRRITFGQGRYANPVWSPRGDLIAFIRMYQGQFYIGVIRPDGSGERLISQAYHIEGPTWAPNGRVLMYFKERPTSGGNDRSAQLYSIDLTGTNERNVPTPGGASDPAWSPPLNPMGKW